MMPYMNQNPNYYAQYMQPQQPYVSPYAQRMEQLQQYQQTLQNNQMQNQFPALGKIVENVDTVKTTEIPYQGVYFFPTADGSTIYTKQWTENGQTRILTFKPVLEDNPNNSMSDNSKIEFGAFGEVLEGIQSELKSLSDKVDKLSKPVKAQKGGSDE